TLNNTIVGQADENQSDVKVDSINSGVVLLDGAANLIRTITMPVTPLVVNNLAAPVDADPKLAALQDNGGRTKTMKLLPGSPAINTGIKSNAPLADQRGVNRDPDGAGSVDLGAYELLPLTSFVVNTEADEATDTDDSTLSLREAIELTSGTLNY